MKTDINLNQTLLDTALSMRKAGRDVIPDHPIQKYPVGFENWQQKNFTEAELSDCIINKGWGLGLRNQEGLDFDNHGNPGAREVIENWKKLVDAICPGLVERLVIEKTQHEGFHAGWKCEAIEGNTILAKRVPTEGELQKDPKLKAVTFIETRGQGGQFVVSPTPGYTLLQGDWCNLPLITPEERKTLLQCARALDLMPTIFKRPTLFKDSTGVSELTDERPGTKFNSEGIDEALGLLKQEGWEEVYQQGAVVYLRRPGKDKGISATFGYVAPGIFYNFTSNGSPFEPNKAYSPFAIFSLLKHRGDFPSAASELAKRYGISLNVYDISARRPSVQPRFFHPALTIDRDRKEVMIGIPVITPSLNKKNEYQVNETIVIVSNKEEVWLLVPVEVEARNLYPTTTPSFGITEPRWSPDFMVTPEVMANLSHSYHSDLKNWGKVSPYSEVFLPIKEIFEKFLDFNNPGYSTLLAIWTMGTYLFPLFEAYPYLYLGGPKGSGKSKVLEILYRLVFNPMSSSNASPSSLFRSIGSTLATILLDEGEMLTGREVNPDLRLLLNAGYKSTGTVTRTNPENFKVEHFQVYSPKSIASINLLDSTLASRCISLIMLRTANKEKGRTRVNDRTLDGKSLRDTLYRWCLDHALEVAKIFDEDKDLSDLNNRDNELYLPLFSIASYIDKFILDGEPKTLPIVRQVATDSIVEEDLLDDWTLWVLEAIDKEVTDFHPYLIKDIRKTIAEARITEEEVLDDHLNNKWIGSCLKKFGFKRGKPTNEGKTYLLKREQIESLKERYGLVPTPTSTVTMDTTDINEAKNKGEHKGEVTIDSQTDKPDSCYLCKGASFYKNPSGVWTCDRCYPSMQTELSYTEEVK